MATKTRRSARTRKKTKPSTKTRSGWQRKSEIGAKIEWMAGISRLMLAASGLKPDDKAVRKLANEMGAQGRAAFMAPPPIRLKSD